MLKCPSVAPSGLDLLRIRIQYLDTQCDRKKALALQAGRDR